MPMLTNQNPKTSFVETTFSARKGFHRYQRMLEKWRAWQCAAVRMGLSTHSVCRTGADRRMKMGDRAMV
jgi:hypothetical protein